MNGPAMSRPTADDPTAGGPGDRGSIAPAIPIIAIMLFLLCGLVVDSARQLDARSRAEAYAQEAARAGAERINLTDQNAVIDPAAARAAVTQFCAAAVAAEPALVECGVTAVDGLQVTVRTEIQMRATMLSAVGLRTLTAGGTGRATAQQGVTGLNSYPGVPAPTVSITKVPLPIPVGTPEPSPTATEPPEPTPTGTPTGSPTGTPRVTTPPAGG